MNPFRSRRSTRDRTLGTGALIAVSLAIGASVWSAGNGDIALPPLGSAAWRELTFPRVARTTHYTPIRSSTLEAVRAVSDCSASALYLPLLRWQWRIERGLDVADEREKSGDDFAARVYVMFAFDAEHATLGQRLRHRLGEALYRRAIPGNAIDYVWASHEPLGATWDNPYAPESKMISLGAGPMLEWRREEVDIETDYRAFFGTAPPAIVAVAVMTDSDDSCQRATAEFADLAFTTRQARPR